MESHPKENDQEAVEDSCPQKLAECWRKTEGTFDCQAGLVFGRRRTSEGGKGTDVRPAGRVHPGEAATEQKQEEVDGKRSAVDVSEARAADRRPYLQCNSKRR